MKIELTVEQLERLKSAVRLQIATNTAWATEGEEKSAALRRMIVEDIFTDLSLLQSLRIAGKREGVPWE